MVTLKIAIQDTTLFNISTQNPYGKLYISSNTQRTTYMRGILVYKYTQTHTHKTKTKKQKNLVPYIKRKRR